MNNTPVEIRKATGIYIISDKTEPWWNVELYINDILFDAVKAGGGILLYPFLDINLNGRHDKGEKIIKVASAKVLGYKTVFNEADSSIRIPTINSFRYCTIEFDDRDLPNIAWSFTKKTYSILVDPSSDTVILFHNNVKELYTEIRDSLSFSSEASEKKSNAYSYSEKIRMITDSNTDIIDQFWIIG